VKLRATKACVATLLVLAGALIAPGGAASQVTVGHSGWEWANPVPQGNSLPALDFLGPIGYAAGEYGTVLSSDDGGVSWRGLISGSTEDLTDLEMINIGSFVVAGDCTVLRSDDGGASLRRLPWPGAGSRCSGPVAGLAFPTPLDGWVLQGDGAIHRTADGGETWREPGALPGGEAGPGFATDIAFADESVGLVATGNGIYRTTDGGASWALVANAPVTGLNGLDLAGPTTAYAVGTGSVLRSTDAGSTWSARPVPAALRTTRFTSIRCADPQLCLITAEPGDRLVRTANGGTSFTSLPSPASGTLAIAFTSPGRAAATGAGGSSAVSSDAGVTWSRVDGSLPGTFTELRGDSASRAFAIGRGGALARTLDGGRSWLTVPAPTTGDVVDVSFAGELTGFLLDDEGVLYRTDDGGNGWQAVFADEVAGFQAVAALDADRVVLVGARGIRRSVDGGHTFSPVGRRSVRRAFLFGVDSAGGLLFAYGPTSLIASRDGGKTWRRLGRPDHRPLAVVDFVGSRVGFALGKGGRAWRTRNRGRSWKEMLAAGTDGGIDIAAVDAGEAYMATNDLFFASGANRPDYVLHTIDGGRRWRPQFLNDSRNVSGVLATSASSGLLLAGGNLLFTTASGGDRGGRSSVTIHAKRRGGRVKVTGRLRPADGGERVIVSRTAADPRQRKGSIDWDFKSAPVGPDGRFRTTWSVRRPSTFVAQWPGDGHRMGAGSRALKVRVRQRSRR
jgi:photosystem II stability/assembly factor-like uncharacterized protein